MSDNQQYGKWTVCQPENETIKHSAKSVFFVRKEEGGELHVIKTLKEGRSYEYFAQEIEAAAKMDHPNVIKVVDHSLDPENPYMVMEYVRGGHTSDLDMSDWTIKEKQFYHIQLCKGMAHILGKGYSFTRSSHSGVNTFVKADGKTPVLGDLQGIAETEYENGITNLLHTSALLFWNIMHREDFTGKKMRERKLNEQIESLTSELEEVKQQKAELLS